jgi:hypothetical protein
VLLRQRGRHLRPRVAGEDLGRRERAGTEDAADEGLAHGAAAEYTQGLIGFEKSHTRITTRSGSKVKSAPA